VEGGEEYGVYGWAQARNLLNDSIILREEEKMEYEQFIELVRKRRSIRRFKPDPIPEEDIEKILEAGRWAMSGGNGQPWEFIVIKDPQIREKVSEAYQVHAWHAYNFENSRLQEMKHPARAAEPTDVSHFKDAPVVIAICGDYRTMMASVVVASLPPDAHVFTMNLGNCMQLMHLAVASLGLGSAWISTSPAVEEALKRLLGVPDYFRLYAMMPVGYPGVDPHPPYRRKLAEITHRDRYDMSKYRSDDDVLAFVAQLRGKTKTAYKTFVKEEL
jgi:nitroreductase